MSPKIGETVVIGDWFGGGGKFRGVRGIVTSVSFFGGTVTVAIPTALGDRIELQVPGRHIDSVGKIQNGLVNT